MGVALSVNTRVSINLTVEGKTFVLTKEDALWLRDALTRQLLEVGGEAGDSEKGCPI